LKRTFVLPFLRQGPHGRFTAYLHNPMQRFLRLVLCAPLCVALPTMMTAQGGVELEGLSQDGQVVVQAVMQGGDPLLQVVWRGVPGAGAVMQVQPTMADAGQVNVMLDRLLLTAIGAYLDARIHFRHDGVLADVPADVMAGEIDAMVRAAVEELEVPTAAPMLSQATRDQLARLARISWEQAGRSVNGTGDQDKYLAIYYFVRSQREELERQLKADLLPLAKVPVMKGGAVDPWTTVQVNSTCGTVYDQENYLCALDLQLASNGEGAIEPSLGARILDSIERHAAASSPSIPVRRRDRWLKAELDAINQRIDRMDQRRDLWELRDRLEDLEDRLTGMEMNVDELQRDAARPENPLADLSTLTNSNITLRFTQASVSIDGENRVLLNEVFEQLARTPQDRVLITGYTDRLGDPSVNLRLSERRAKAVRDHLLQRGIAPERLLVNYYGDSRSTGPDPSERRVEVEWLR
jgi:outer membrane protein OmpA-like peptidoglycan-associated protein